jgi:hypothetical protein
MRDYVPKPIKTAHYDALPEEDETPVDLDLVAAGGAGVPARKIRCGTAGNLVILNDDGSEATIPVESGQEIEGAFRAILAENTTAEDFTVVWYG